MSDGTADTLKRPPDDDDPVMVAAADALAAQVVELIAAVGERSQPTAGPGDVDCYVIVPPGVHPTPEKLDAFRARLARDAGVDLVAPDPPVDCPALTEEEVLDGTRSDVAQVQPQQQ